MRALAGIYWHDEEQRKVAEARVAELDAQLAAGTGNKRWAGSKARAHVEASPTHGEPP